MQMDAFLFVSSCDVSWWFCFTVKFHLFLFGLLQIPVCFGCFFNVPLYMKRTELKKLRSRREEFYVTKFLFWYIKQRDLSSRLCQIVLLFYLYFLSHENRSVKKPRSFQWAIWVPITDLDNQMEDF